MSWYDHGDISGRIRGGRGYGRGRGRGGGRGRGRGGGTRRSLHVDDNRIAGNMTTGASMMGAAAVAAMALIAYKRWHSKKTVAGDKTTQEPLVDTEA